MSYISFNKMFKYKQSHREELLISFHLISYPEVSSRLGRTWNHTSFPGCAGLYSVRFKINRLLL